MNTTPELSPDYYLTNFRFLVNWVVKRYEDLLSQAERDFVAIFENLPHQSQCLYVRLASRTGRIFRADKLRYREITNIGDAASFLIDCGLIDLDRQLSIDEISRTLTKPELQHLFFQNQKAAPKSELIDCLNENYPAPRTWAEWTGGQYGQLYCVNSQDILNTFILLFFGNSRQDLKEFVLQDLGLFRYEEYTIDHRHRIFKTREELNQYQLLTYLREQLALAKSNDDLHHLATQIPMTISSEILLRRKSKLCNKIADAAAKQKNYPLALDLYAKSHLAPSRERQIRLLEKQTLHNEAWEILQAIAQDPWNEQELHIAERISARLAKKLGKVRQQKLAVQLPERHLSLNRVNIALNVEEITRLHFHTNAAPCLYVENQLLLGLFGLWLWPEIFRGVDGAFANPFQSAPLDMYEPSFITKRPAIEKLFEMFETNTHRDHIKSVWNTKHGISNHFVNWQFLQGDLIDIALDNIPAEHLKLIFQRILFDIKNNRSGLPDLIQFFPETKSYLMIEVKGPGDRVQDNQRLWFNFFAKHKIPAEVVYVNWQ